ncbi:PREDICTED: peroxisome assembly protein 12-like [Amphimedon queenslandica]|uniref:Peroxisome assembly protein 12 n=1 Tax=Amphimedon queenslandica TaxID=400682 RepID=A0A1X7UFA3_AMPQE|nr:PREDICTED: peroxisome assembly protein 12-like [Amphimedon queenslandica]|eukprot:XP_019854657.1 PREDICTED: peroxisome assembly protein 12-like [Amphimedon queenslandica]
MAAFNEQLLHDKIPTIFELIAEDSMSQALRPAIRHVTKIVISSLPSISRLSRYIDEICLVIEGLAQGLFLWRCNATISEKFYDLERYSCNAYKMRQTLKSLAIMLFVPYALAKIEKWYLLLSEESEFVPLEQSRSNLKQSFKYYGFSSIPYIFTLWRAVKFIFQLLYLCRYSLYYSPELFMSRVQLVRKIEPFTPDNGTKHTSNVLKKGVQYVGPLFLFLLKFIEWWYSGERQGAVKKFRSLPNPQPPPLATPEINPYTCPLCQKERKNPTALSCSGYVFCYVCIYNHVKNHHTCPVTLFPAVENQLIRIFVQN